VWARTGAWGGTRGVTAFLVPAGTAGLVVGRHEQKMGIRASSTVSLAFDDCALPLDAVLGAPGEGFRIAMTALDGGRMGIAAQATGTVRAALEASIRYAQARRAFGHAIADFQAMRWALADIATEHDAARLLTLRAAWLKSQGEPYIRAASMAKLYASEAAQRAVSKAVQIHGGYGYTDAFPVERYFRDARVQTIYEGTSEIQRLVIARDLLR
jgi:alkylation response protein AidB-like acyl-CoA dehydrogenase